ncbi:MAG TPA: flotillin domain-containing protein [Roseiarcus sp.]|nr:flotillin domain-containing protein [Roseiarcus sp.]
MNGADIIAIIILATIVIAIVVYLLHWLYRHSSKDLSFVRTGLGGEKVVMGGGALVLPIVHDVTEVSMNTLRIEVRRAGERSLITRNRMRIEVIVEFFLRVIPTAEAVATAARTLGARTLDPESLRDLVQGRFVDAMGAIAAQMTMEEIHEHRADYIRGVRALVAESLTANGLELETASLTGIDQTDIKLFNPTNAFDAEGMTRLTEEIESRKKKRNEIEQDSIIAIRAKNLEAEQQSLAIERESEYARLEQEREISVRRAQQRAEVAAEKAQREREIEEAQIEAKEAVERARIRHELAINAENIAREREIERLEIHRRQALEMDEQNRVVAIAVNEAENRTRLTEETETRKRRRNEIEQETAVSVHTKNLESELRVLAIRKQSEFARFEQERDVEQRRVMQRAEIAFEKLEREREVDEATLRAKEAVERARVRTDLAVETEQIQRAQETERLEIERQRLVEIAEQERLIALAEKEREKALALIETENVRTLLAEAQEGVVTAREREIAERRKRIDLIEAEQIAERNALRITAQAAAEKQAAIEHAEAERVAAEASRHRYEAEAEGQRKLNEAENLRSDASRRTALNRKLFENLPAIIRESVKPMERIESIKILQVEGLPGFSNGPGGGPGAGGSGGGDSVGGGGDGRPGNLAESVVNAAMRYRSQIPFVDNLLKEVGMNPTNLSDLTDLSVRLEKPPAKGK